MRLSARNVLKGRVIEVKKGVTTAHVKVEIGKGAIVTASITMEAVKELKLKVGDKAAAIIKASDVMIGSSETTTVSNYYESDDLKKFGEIGQHAKQLADDFFKYYGDVTGTDGALTKREKALIALAVSHAQKCPYCIDAYTTQCLETGANPEQMMEAVHVAAVMQAGITLVHSVQMQNHLKKLVL